HRGDAGRGGAAIDRGVFADDAPLADLHPGLLVGILEILWRPTENGPGPDLGTGGDSHVALEGDPCGNPGTAGDLDRWSDDRKWSDLDVVIDFGRRIDQHCGMDSLAHRSTTRAII